MILHKCKITVCAIVRAAITNCRNTRETIEKSWIVNNKNSFVWPSITHQDICVSSAWSFYCRLLNKSKKYLCTFKVDTSKGPEQNFEISSTFDCLSVREGQWDKCILLHHEGIYSVLSSMSLPAKTARVPMMHTAMNTQSRMWSKTMATNFHSSAACNKTVWKKL